MSFKSPFLCCISTHLSLGKRYSTYFLNLFLNYCLLFKITYHINHQGAFGGKKPNLQKSIVFAQRRNTYCLLT